MKLGHWQKIPEVTLILSFQPKGSILSLFLHCGQRFPNYGRIFKIAIFGHDTLVTDKDPEIAHRLSFYPMWSKLSLFSLYGQRFLRYGLISKLTHLGMKLDHWHVYPISASGGGRNWADFRYTGSGF